jgi:hypothetical protein
VNRVLAAAVLAIPVAVALAACTGAPHPSASAVPPTTTAVPLLSSRSFIDAGLTNAPPSAQSDHAVGIVPCSERSADRYGQFVRACLRKDAPVLRYDPRGTWAWLHDPAQAPLAVSVGYVSSAVRQAGRLLVDLIDSTAEWDDAPEAWTGVQSQLHSVVGKPADGLRDQMRTHPEAAGVFDVGGWREKLGYRPAPYPKDVPRVRVLDLDVTDISLQGGKTLTRKNVGVAVEVTATLSQPVVDADGTTWELRQEVTLTASSLESTRKVVEIEWEEDHQVSRSLTGGQNSLPQLVVHRATPQGWSRHSVDRLHFALPRGSVTKSKERVEGTDRIAAEYEVAGTGAALEVSGPYVFTDADPDGDWWVLPGFDNYGLRVPGATSAAAEVGRDDQGRFRARIDLQMPAPAGMAAGTELSYHLEWDTTPERAVDELRTMVGAMSLGPTSKASGTKAKR